jgi:hypothetical protein
MREGSRRTPECCVGGLVMSDVVMSDVAYRDNGDGPITIVTVLVRPYRKRDRHGLHHPACRSWSLRLHLDKDEKKPQQSAEKKRQSDHCNEERMYA